MVMRVGGLASGMDIDSIVEKLMQAEKAPLNKLYQNKQKYEWQRDAYREVNKKLKAFDDFLFGSMTLAKDLNKKTVQSSNPAISATPTTAKEGEVLNIDSINQLAKAGNAVGKPSLVNPTAQVSKSTTMSELGITEDKQITLKVLQADGSMKTLNPITIGKNDTIQNVLDKFKNQAGLNAFYDEQTNQFAISTKATGAGESVTENGATKSSSLIVENGQEVFTALGFGSSKNIITNGQNAKFTVNGATIERSSNTFDFEGFKVSLNDVYNGAQPISLTSKTDVDNMVDKIKKFVETYNGLVESFNTQLKEPKYRDYQPLTDEQKEEMEADEIKAWEEKAKSGTLRGDSLIRTALGNMRGIMYEKGGSSNPELDTLYELGITTSKKMSDNGKLEIDETKLRAAIEKDPDAVFRTFSNTDESKPGIVQQLRKSIDGTIKNIEKKAGKTDSTNQSFQIGRQIYDAENRITNWKTKLADIEARYWKQFTAMEEAINKANQQSSIFATGA